MSAVDQGYRYAINLPCDWIIVTSTRETRLYHKGSNQHSYERFEPPASPPIPPSSSVSFSSSARTAWFLQKATPTFTNSRVSRSRTHHPILRPLRRHPPKSLHPALSPERRHPSPGNSPLHPKTPGSRSLLRLLRRPRPAAKMRFVKTTKKRTLPRR
jgi:hypothetical protein